jgi:hypothetical protein
MPRLFLYLPVGLITFALCMGGMFVLLTPYESQPAIRSLSGPSSEEEPLKYGCESKEMESFWENLDMESFRELKRRERKVWLVDPDFTDHPRPDEVEKDWLEFENTRFSCSYLEEISKVLT